MLDLTEYEEGCLSLKRARVWILEVAWVWGGSAERLGPRSQIRLCEGERRSVEETRGSGDSSQPGASRLSLVQIGRAHV